MMKTTMRSFGMIGLAAVTAMNMMGAAFAAEDKTDETMKNNRDITYRIEADDGGDGITFTFAEGDAAALTEDAIFVTMVKTDDKTGKMYYSEDKGATWKEIEESMEADGGSRAAEITPSIAAEVK